jgi:Protein of unknown function (DUF1592)/Protein of unknown function (DUF1588)/Protein of unknown function (DUF1595)/Protein of unknown function (DUF1587)
MYPRGKFAGLVGVIAVGVGFFGCVSDPGVSLPGGGGGAGASSGSGGTVGITSPLIPARIRRLTNGEYDASIRALLGTSLTMAATFPPDSRQGIFSRGGFTLNDAQRVDPVLAKQLSDSAIAVIAEARGNGRLANLAPCANVATGGEACANTFIQSFGARAFRRSLTTDEKNAFVAVYRVGATGGSYDDGIDMVVRAALQSAGFLYITEIGGGTGAAGANVTLTSDESSSVLSYLLTSSPPDDTLLAMARTGGLMDGEMREQQARRLLALPRGQDNMVRFVREMFSLDQITLTDKDTTAYPAFAGAKNSIVAESENFVREVLVRSTGTIDELLGADWTIADSTLAGLYGVSSAGTGRTSLGAVGRRGLLNQAAFLSVFAHASESAPVLRGVAIMRQVACMPLRSPTELNIDVTPPPVDPGKTTRQRFADHVSDKLCASCHTSIDGFGFAFETFDGMGAARPVQNGHPTENGLAIETATAVVGTDFDAMFADSNQLAAALATSAQVRTCLARQIFRSSTGRSDDSVKGSEDAFVEYWKQVPAAQQGNILETLVAYVKNPTFIQRRPQ